MKFTQKLDSPKNETYPEIQLLEIASHPSDSLYLVIKLTKNWNEPKNEIDPKMEFIQKWELPKNRTYLDRWYNWDVYWDRNKRHPKTHALSRIYTA